MSKTLQQTIGIRVRAAREARRLTQEELASRVSRSVETISNVERGYVLAGVDTLCELARELGVAVGEFLDEPAPAVRLPRLRLESEIRELLRQIGDEDLEVAKEQVQALARRRQRT